MIDGVNTSPPNPPPTLFQPEHGDDILMSPASSENITPSASDGESGDTLTEDVSPSRSLNDVCSGDDGPIATVSASSILPLSFSVLTERERALRAVLNPIQLLPVEILLSIFGLANTETAIALRPSFAWCLMSVCRWWRDLVVGGPELWTTFHASWSPARQALVLQRARRRPMDVIIARDSPANTHLPPLHLWRSLDVSFSPHLPSWHLFRSCMLHLGSVEHLTLNIESHDTDDASMHQISTLNIALIFPNVTHLIVRDIPHTIVWSTLGPALRALQLDIAVSDRGLRKIFQLCTGLEKLTLHSIIPQGLPVWGGQAPLGNGNGTMWAQSSLQPPPTLRELVLCRTHEQYIRHLFRWLEAPGLTSLTLRSFESLQWNSQNDALAIPDSQIRNFFEQLHNLEHLSLKCDHILMHNILSGMQSMFACPRGSLTRKIEQSPFHETRTQGERIRRPHPLLPHLSSLTLIISTFGGMREAQVVPQEITPVKLLFRHSIRTVLDMLRCHRAAEPLEGDVRGREPGLILDALRLAAFGVFTKEDIAELRPYTRIFAIAE